MRFWDWAVVGPHGSLGNHDNLVLTIEQVEGQILQNVVLMSSCLLPNYKSVHVCAGWYTGSVFSEVLKFFRALKKCFLRSDV